ncbi:MAG TPA: OmpA family protein [Steroidobacteraceae bacterium]|jgi:outer membrane protein OmpA-like peptidoglycan-associated protein|nr:OmpA family protein [Steroidobacteraceae bacterium]
MEALNLSTGRGRAALSLTCGLLLAVCASAPAAQGRIVVDARTMAQAAADGQKRELEEMRNVNADARRNALHLQQHIDSLQAEVIDRGLLLTLDDAQFAGNSARLSNGGSTLLDQLVSFLDDYPYRSAQIESSAACKASAGYDALLSQRRAVAVASYLTERGVAAARLSTRSKEISAEDEDCDPPALHRNRQVMVIIEDVLTSAR